MRLLKPSDGGEFVVFKWKKNNNPETNIFPRQIKNNNQWLSLYKEWEFLN